MTILTFLQLLNFLFYSRHQSLDSYNFQQYLQDSPNLQMLRNLDFLPYLKIFKHSFYFKNLCILDDSQLITKHLTLHISINFYFLSACSLIFFVHYWSLELFIYLNLKFILNSFLSMLLLHLLLLAIFSDFF